MRHRHRHLELVACANAAAYAARDGKGFLIALINKDAARDLTVRLDGVAGHRVRRWNLTAPALDATERVRFEEARASAAEARDITLPHASATLLLIQ